MHTHIHEYMCEYIHPYIHTVKIEVGSTAATRCEGERVALVQGKERRLGFDSEGRCKTPRDSPSPRESREEWWRARSSVLFCLLSLSLSDETCPFTWQLHSRASACFRPLECQIHLVAAEGVTWQGLFKEEDENYFLSSGTFPRLDRKRNTNRDSVRDCKRERAREGERERDRKISA